MSELEAMAQMARLEVEIGEKAIKYSIDVLKFGITTIKKLAMLFAGLKYAKNKGATNLDNLVLKTNGNTQLVQIPDELQKDFEQFCKKHGILMSKLYDLNVSDGKKQYAIDANKADAVFNAFAIDVMEKYKKGSRAEEYKTKMELCGSELKNVYKQYDTAVMLLERMRHGMIENELDALAVVFQIKRAANLQIILAPYKIDVVLQPHYPETLLHITRTKILPCKLIAQEYSVSSYENGSSSSSIWQA